MGCMIGLQTMSEIASGGSLVARILQGDQSAEEELVQVYWRGGSALPWYGSATGTRRWTLSRTHS